MNIYQRDASLNLIKDKIIKFESIFNRLINNMEYILHDEIERLEKENKYMLVDIKILIKYIARKQLNFIQEEYDLERIKKACNILLSNDKKYDTLYYKALKELNLMD